MCGICGFLDKGKKSSLPVLKSMTDSMLNRGPDSAGYELWDNSAYTVGLGHRRLSIIDLSSNGHQPMRSNSGRYTIAFNGEIYNFKTLRSKLEASGVNCKGASDTNVLVNGMELWGLESVLQKAVGMFAIAIWDSVMETLLLARDRMGEKPLYYGYNNGNFLFASDLLAMTRHPEANLKIDKRALNLYLRHGYVPTPYSIYEDIKKLPPGCILTLSAKDYLLGNRTEQISHYWHLEAIYNDSCADKYDYTSPEALTEQLETLLVDSIQGQMLADVPLGAFLSGGIDSSTIVALMQKHSIRPIKTFSIGFHCKENNEAEFARDIARHLGTDHCELYVDGKDALSVIPKLAGIYSEPFADSSQIPTYLVAKLASLHVKVALSGDGGDELFCGYPIYRDCVEKWDKFRMIPGKRILRKISGSRFIHKIAEFMEQGRSPYAAKFLYYSADILGCQSLNDFYRERISVIHSPIDFTGMEDYPSIINLLSLPHSSHPIDRLSIIDMHSYLPDDILVKVDRAAMASSLETRVPMLDHRIVEFAARLPVEIKTYNGRNKYPLCSILNKYVPTTLTDRPKKGFSIPLSAWLKNELRDWAHTLLDNKIVEEAGLNHKMVAKLRDAHFSGRNNYGSALWNILIYIDWYLHRCKHIHKQGTR